MDWIPYALSGAGGLILLLLGVVAYFLKNIFEDTKKTFGIVTILQAEWVDAKEDLRRARALDVKFEALEKEFERLRDGYSNGNGNGRYADY